MATLQSPRSLHLCTCLSYQSFVCISLVIPGTFLLLITRPSGCRVQTFPSECFSVACLQNQNRVKTNRQNESLKHFQPASPAAAGFSLASASRELAEFVWMYGHEPAAAAVTRRCFNVPGTMGGLQRIQSREFWCGLGRGWVIGSTQLAAVYSCARVFWKVQMLCCCQQNAFTVMLYKASHMHPAHIMSTMTASQRSGFASLGCCDDHFQLAGHRGRFKTLGCNV